MRFSLRLDAVLCADALEAPCKGRPGRTPVTGGGDPPRDARAYEFGDRFAASAAGLKATARMAADRSRSC